MIAGDQLDVAFMTLNEYDRTKDNYISLSNEEILLGVPDGHPICQSATPSPGHPWPILDLNLLKYEPFVLMDKKSTMCSLVERIFQESGFEPNILFETQNNNLLRTHPGLLRTGRHIRNFRFLHAGPPLLADCGQL